MADGTVEFSVWLDVDDAEKELNAIKNELGQNFKVTLSPRDKSSLTICIMAPSDDFIALLQKKPAPTTFHRTMFDNNNGGGDTNGGKN